MRIAKDGCSGIQINDLAVARRAGMKKAKVALARKLAVVLHRMLRTGEGFALDGRPVAPAA